MTKTPEIAIDAADAKRLGEAVAAVMAFHKVKMTAKQEAYATLMDAAVQVYPPMILSIYLRKKTEAEKKPKTDVPRVPLKGQAPPAPAQKPATVTPIRGNMGPQFDTTNIHIPE